MHDPHEHAAPPEDPLETVWSSREADGDEHPDGSLSERLAGWASDRVHAAHEVVLGTAEVLAELARDEPFDGPVAETRRRLEGALAAWSASHSWRAGPARLLRALDGALDVAERVGAGGRDALVQELSYWLAPADDDAEPGPWSGRALEPGRRLDDRLELARRLADGLAVGETVVVLGYGETVALALELAREAGRGPTVLIGESGLLGEGRRMVRRLQASGLELSLLPSVALPDRLVDADRVWLATEAMGERTFLAPVGVAALARSAGDLGVPVELAVAADERWPAGEPAPPAWGERDTWMLLADAPPGVLVEAQPYASVPIRALTRRVVLEAPPAALPSAPREAAARAPSRPLR